MRAWVELLQERFDALEKKRKWLLALLPFLVVSAGVYYLFIEPTMEEIEFKQERIEQLSQEMAKHSSRRYEKMIEAKKKEILSMQGEIDRLRSEALALRSKLDEKRFVFLEGQNFAKLLEDMLQSSVQNRLELSQIAIEDKEVDSVGKLKIEKSMHIEGVGEFLNIVKFVRSVEAHPVLMSVYHLSVETNGTTPAFKVDIDFYGVDG